MHNFKGAIFDLDGTLLDSMWIWEQIDIEFLGRRGLPVPDDYLKKITPMHFYQAAEYTIGRFGLPETPDDLIAEWSDMALDAYRHRIGLKPYAKEYLLFLKDKGVKLSVATASSEEIYTPALKRNGIYDLFDAFTSSSEAARGKGFPDVYELAAEKVGLTAKDCAAVLKVPPKRIENDKRACVSNMEKVVHRRPAGINLNLAGLHGLKFFFLPCQGIV